MTGTLLKQYIDAIPPMIPTSLAQLGAGALASLNSLDLGTALATGTLPVAKLPDSGVSAGNYTLASLTVDSKGRVTAISSGSAVAPVVSVFGRTGTITAQNSDYSIGQIAGAGALAALGSVDLASVNATGTLAAARLGSFAGDLTNFGYTLTIGAGKVTYGKIQQASAGVLLGNPGGAAANVQEISLGNGLAFSGSTLAATGTPPVEVTTATIQLQPNTRYIMNSPTLVTGTLPTTMAQGAVIYIDGKGAGGWKVAQNAGQTIHTYSDTTTGTAGSLSSSAQYDNVALVCIAANTDFEATARNGSLVVA